MPSEALCGWHINLVCRRTKVSSLSRSSPISVTRSKTCRCFLRAAKRVVESQPNAHFVIAGEGELEAELKGLASSHEVAENVHFIGRCGDVPPLLAVSYACVLTSTAEGFSNSILEYMAAGKPVVATNVGGAAEAVADGESGYLVASDDDAAMASRLDRPAPK